MLWSLNGEEEVDKPWESGYDIGRSSSSDSLDIRNLEYDGEKSLLSFGLEGYFKLNLGVILLSS